MPADERLRAQIDLILKNIEGARAFPADWLNAGDVDYLYRDGVVLTSIADAERVVAALQLIYRETRTFDAADDAAATEEAQFERQHVGAGVIKITVSAIPRPVPDVLNRLDELVGPGAATPDHILFVCPISCPATEPGVVPPGTVTPFPPPGLDTCGRRGAAVPGCDGDGVFVSIVDTGLMPHAASGHPWLAGVHGKPEEIYHPGTDQIRPYAGHGTFVAGCLRCMAPRASVYVERAFDIAGANYESDLLPSLHDVLRRNPDVLVFTFCASTRHDLPLITFDHFYERHLRYRKGLVVLAPAGNDGNRRPMWPAAFPWVVSAGALSASWRDRAWFSNFGRWVDVYAPGQDLINAYPSGTYVCTEPPIGEHREFHGMAVWNGTSFSTPIVAGLIAARMSATGENGQQAAESLLRLARGQAIPGVGAALYPGQACCDVCREHGQACSTQAKPRCGCG